MTYRDPLVENRKVALIERLQKMAGERLVLAGQSLNSNKLKHLGVRLGAGKRPGLRLHKEEYMVTAAPGTIMKTKLLVTGSAVMTGVIFDGRGDSPLIEVSGFGRLVLLNCIVTKEPGQSALGSYISVGPDAKLQASGCLFTGDQTSGLVIDTLGGSAASVGNMNTTGVAHNAGVVVSGEVT